MIFRRLTLNNFRQFVGTHDIHFASTPEKNVTVIHGDNGAGKTTLLNAFTWLLYQETSEDFKFPERLGSESAFAELSPESSAEVFVELEFEDAGRVYTVKRSTTVLKDINGKRVDPGATILKVVFIDESGEAQEPGNPANFIEHLLPKPLYPFFFFNGERIERLASESAFDEVENGVTVLMDVELFDRSISHLDKEISRRLRDEIAGHSGEEGKQVKGERDALEQQLTKRAEELEQIRKNQKARASEREAIDKKLALMPELARLQEERKGAEAALSRDQEDLKNTTNELCKVVSRDGYLILAADALISAREKLAEAHQAGDLPVKIKRQFVDELLAREICICGREIKPTTPEHSCVAEWRNKARSDALEAAVSVTKAEIEPLMTRRQRALEEIDRLQLRRADLKKGIRLGQEKCEQLSSDILKITSHPDVEDPERLEARRRKIEQDDKVDILRVSSLENDSEADKQKIAGLDARLTKLDKTDEQARLAERRLVAVSNVSTALKKIRVLRHENLQEDLSERLATVWDQITLKDYSCELGPQYHLSLVKHVGGERVPVYGASTGEQQILSLAFVGALVDKAKSTFEQHGDDPSRMFRGGKYPIVMDSAFGNLGPDYRRGVASAIPVLAPQVVVLVSETQWRIEVEQELSSKIGKEYILCLRTQKKKDRSVTLHNHQYEYVRQTSDSGEQTEILEVEL